jgi:hypothetical protein
LYRKTIVLFIDVGILKFEHKRERVLTFNQFDRGKMIASTLLILGLLSTQEPAPTPDQPDQVSSTSVLTSSDASNALAASESDFSNYPSALVETYQFEVDPNGAPVGLTWSEGNRFSRAIWGASYAISTEYIQLYYEGKAKAAANVYQNLRIVEVCIWYTRDSVAVSSKACSGASNSSDFWAPGPEVIVTTIDSLDWSAPKTIFNIKTVKIDPSVL